MFSKDSLSRRNSRNNSSININPAPLSPTIDGIESQSKASLNTQNPTTTTTATATPATGRSTTSIHVTALDGIVNVNSLFTMAIFIGFSLTVPASGSAGNPASCTVSIKTIRRLIVFEVASFSFFLFSSLIAQTLKLTINLLNSLDASDPQTANIDTSFHKYCLFSSSIGSVIGCVFLVLSIVDFVQVKLGVLSCGGEPVYAVVTLVVFVGSALLVYFGTSIFVAFFVTKEENNTLPAVNTAGRVT